jgi:hypothetical protein
MARALTERFTATRSPRHVSASQGWVGLLHSVADQRRAGWVGKLPRSLLRLVPDRCRTPAAFLASGPEQRVPVGDILRGPDAVTPWPARRR